MSRTRTPTLKANPMVTSAAVLAMSLCAAASNAWCDEHDSAADAAAHSVLPVDRTSSVFPGRWCINTYLSEARRSSHVRGGASRATSGLPLSLVSQAGDGMSTPEYLDRSSVIKRLMEIRSLRLMTLWRGRDTALVFGVDDSGYLGVSLDDSVASAD